jgi:hypothetical protein
VVDIIIRDVEKMETKVIDLTLDYLVAIRNRDIPDGYAKRDTAFSNRNVRVPIPIAEELKPANETKFNFDKNKSPEEVFGGKNKRPLEDVFNNTDLLDSAGVTWDPEIHTRTQSKNADGRWKIKRNLTDAGEQHEVSAAPTIVIPKSPSFTPKSETSVPTESFADFVSRVSKLVNEGKISSAWVLDTCKSLGIEDLLTKYLQVNRMEILVKDYELILRPENQGDILTLSFLIEKLTNINAQFEKLDEENPLAGICISFELKENL